MSRRTRTPVTMRVRGATRAALRKMAEDRRLLTQPTAALPPLALVALSGGADSLALAAATAAEAASVGVRAGAVIIDHGLQPGSDGVAQRAAEQAAKVGLEPVVVRRVEVERGLGSATGGIEAAARTARYEAFAAVASELDAHCVLTAHTRDDQAEQVLLALARGSGTRSLAGIPAKRHLNRDVWLLRPFLSERWGVNRKATEESCAELGLEPWHDPHNSDATYARVRVRREVLPELERQLGPGFAAALARSADLAREDADALDALAEEWLQGILDHNSTNFDSYSLPAESLGTLPAALRNRVIRLAALTRFGTQLSRTHTLAVAALATDWRGQGPIAVPGGNVLRRSGYLQFRAH